MLTAYGLVPWFARADALRIPLFFCCFKPDADCALLYACPHPCLPAPFALHPSVPSVLLTSRLPL